jgi:hypothetical protein
MTIDQAHMIATSGDRIFHVEGMSAGNGIQTACLNSCQSIEKTSAK